MTDAGKNQIPRVAIRSICGGLLLMTFFTMMWTGVAQAGLQGMDNRIILIAFSLASLIFVFYAVRLFIRSYRFPEFTTIEDRLEGRKMGKSFGIIFGIEGLAIPVAATALSLTGNERFIMPAIGLIVGLHFYPMAKIFNRTIDYYLASWACLVSLTGIIMLWSGNWTQFFMLGTLGIGMALTTMAYGFYMIAEGNRMVLKSAESPAR